MSFTVAQLNPKKPSITINDQTIVLSFITLEKDVALSEVYKSLPGVYDAVKEDARHLIPVVWELVLDKTQFGNSYSTFYKFLYSSKESSDKWSQKLMAAFNDSVHKSMPLIINKEREKDISQLQEAKTEQEPCYAVYYDSLAKRYGYTLDQFYQLTLRQVSILLKTVSDKSYDDLEVQAALLGRKLKPRMDMKVISKEQEKANEDQAMAALKGLQDDYKRRQEAKDK